MSNLPAWLILHGAMMLLMGLACGAPMGSAINNDKGEDVVRAWRVAHSSLSMGGIMLLAIASVLPKVSLGVAFDTAVVGAFVVSPYGFILALPLGARTGQRGLRRGVGIGSLVYIGNMVGASGAFVGVLLLVLAAMATTLG